MRPVTPYRLAIAASLLLVGLSACAGAPPAPGPPARKLDASSDGWISFATTTPYDFPEMGRADLPEAVIQGKLTLPPDAVPVRGAAILSHGSGGLGGRQRLMAERLADQGIAAFALDHFGARGITSTVEDQLRLTAQAMLADLMAARALLATHPRIPEDRIGVIGWSKGGIAAVLGAVDRLAERAAAGGSERFAFSAAFYPFCGFDLGQEQLANPLLLLLGGADDWTPPAPCQALAEAWAAAGQPAESVVFDGAPHGFDAGLPFTITVDRAISVRKAGPGCTLGLSAEGRTETLDGRHRLDSAAARRAYLEACGTRGVQFGGDHEARTGAYARLDAFLAGILRRP